MQSSNKDIGLQSSASVTVSALKEIVLAVGMSKITVNNAGVTIEGAQITSSATGIHQLKGATIKMN